MSLAQLQNRTRSMSTPPLHTGPAANDPSRMREFIQDDEKRMLYDMSTIKKMMSYNPANADHNTYMIGLGMNLMVGGMIDGGLTIEDVDAMLAGVREVLEGKLKK